MILFPIVSPAFPSGCSSLDSRGKIMTTFYRTNLAHGAVLGPLVFVLVNCAGPITEEQKYERLDRYNQMVSEYEEDVKRCRRTGGSMISSGSWSRQIGGRLSLEQISNARCFSRR